MYRSEKGNENSTFHTKPTYIIIIFDQKSTYIIKREKQVINQPC